MASEFDKVNEMTSRIEKHFDDLSDMIYEKLDKDLKDSLDKNKNVTITVGGWKNTIVERLMYFFLGVLIGLTITHYL